MDRNGVTEGRDRDGTGSSIWIVEPAVPTSLPCITFGEKVMLVNKAVAASGYRTILDACGESGCFEGNGEGMGVNTIDYSLHENGHLSEAGHNNHLWAFVNADPDKRDMGCVYYD